MTILFIIKTILWVVGSLLTLLAGIFRLFTTSDQKGLEDLAKLAINRPEAFKLDRDEDVWITSYRITEVTMDPICNSGLRKLSKRLVLSGVAILLIALILTISS